jgi:hypothetical protein
LNVFIYDTYNSIVNKNKSKFLIFIKNINESLEIKYL